MSSLKPSSVVYSPFCVDLVGDHEERFSHEAAQLEAPCHGDSNEHPKLVF